MSIMVESMYLEWRDFTKESLDNLVIRYVRMVLNKDVSSDLETGKMDKPNLICN